MGNQQPLQPSDPRTIGGYLVEARLGTGGMGVVFVGRGVEGEAVAMALLH